MPFMTPQATADLSRIVIDGVGYPVKSAQVTATSSGDTQLIAAVTAKQIKILSWEMFSDTAMTVTLQDASNNTLAGPWYPAANGGIVNPMLKENDQIGTSGERVDAVLSTNGNVNVKAWYVEV